MRLFVLISLMFVSNNAFSQDFSSHGWKYLSTEYPYAVKKVIYFDTVQAETDSLGRTVVWLKIVYPETWQWGEHTATHSFVKAHLFCTTGKIGFSKAIVHLSHGHKAITNTKLETGYIEEGSIYVKMLEYFCSQ